MYVCNGQEGFYQNCVFHYRWGRGFAPDPDLKLNGTTINIVKEYKNVQMLTDTIYYACSPMRAKPLHRGL